MSNTAFFDLNDQLKLLGLLDGAFDGRRVQPTSRGRLVHLAWSITLSALCVRYLANIRLPHLAPAQFLLHHFFYFVEDRFADLVYYCIFLTIVWSLLLVLVFRRLCRRRRTAHWLVYFSAKHCPTQLPGIAAAQLLRYRGFCARTLRLLRRWFLRWFNLCLCLAHVHYSIMPSALPWWVHWPVCAVNMASFHLYATQVQACLNCVPVCMGLLCRLQGLRFDNVRTRFRRLASHGKRLDEQHPIHRGDHATAGWLDRLRSAYDTFQLVALDQLRMNRFWSRVFALNMHLGMATVVVGLFGSYATGSWIVITGTYTICSSIYLSGLVLPTFFAGVLVRRVRRSDRRKSCRSLVPKVLLILPTFFLRR